jgi:hypothetical protein
MLHAGFLVKNGALGGPTMDGVLLIPVNHPNGGNVRLIIERVIGQRQNGKSLAADRPHGLSGRAAHFTVQFSLGHVSSPKWGKENRNQETKKGRLAVKQSGPWKQLIVSKQSLGGHSRQLGDGQFCSLSDWRLPQL